MAAGQKRIGIGTAGEFSVALYQDEFATIQMKTATGL